MRFLASAMVGLATDSYALQRKTGIEIFQYFHDILVSSMPALGRLF